MKLGLHVPGSRLAWLAPLALALLVGCDGDPAGPAVTAPSWAEVDAGRTHTCAITARGLSYCWGRGADGALGNGGTFSVPYPTRVVSADPFGNISVGGGHSCAISANGSAHCWGDNGRAELGDGTKTASGYPVRVNTGVLFTAVTAGTDHTCALSLEGEVRCWGWGFLGQLGTGETIDLGSAERIASEERFSGVSAGDRHTCAVAVDRRAYCWGTNAYGQLGSPDSGERCGTVGDVLYPCRPTPTLVDGGIQFIEVSAGSRHTCGVTASGDAYCWGANELGQLGNGTKLSTAVPSRVIAPVPFVSISAGAEHSCAVSSNGAAYCWGRDFFGRLGAHGREHLQPLPTPVAGDLTFVTISAGHLHTCAITAAARLYCWGHGGFGQLGTGLLTPSPFPVEVVGP